MSIRHSMKLNAIPFEVTKTGLKTIEIRLNDNKRRGIKPGDDVEFQKAGSDETVQAKVISVRPYKTLHELTLKEDFSKTGGIYSDRAKWTEAINSYYSREDQSRYGLLSIEIAIRP